MTETPGQASFPDIVYLMGTGRSGTTILEILLANNPGFFGVGEVTHIFGDGFVRNVSCSCGAPARNCRVWSDVRHQCRWTDDKDKEHDALFHRYAWHSRFPALALGLDSQVTRERFRTINRCLFSAVQSVSGAEVVVDSSKYAGRALALARAFPERILVICVTRSPAGLINAFRKTDAGEQRSKSLLAVCMYYAYVMLCLRFAIWRLGKRVLHLHYEELGSRPIEALGRIGRFLGRDLGPSMQKVSHNKWLGIGHIVTGNRIRLEGKIRFRSSADTERLAGRRERLVAWLMNACRRILGL